MGVIPVTLEPAAGGLTLVTMTQRSPEFGPPWADRAGVAELLSADEWMLHPSYPVQTVSCGLPYLIVPIRDLEAMRRLAPRPALWRERLEHTGAVNVMAFTLQTARRGATAHCRMFAPTLGVLEDPATGSAAGPLGCYFVQHGISAAPAAASHEFIFEQGLEIGRPSLLHAAVDRQGDRITRVRVFGTCVSIGSGQLEVSAAP
jgi:trans-2,3-dihydro-3-hydroxyanthranilate isomerase